MTNIAIFASGGGTNAENLFQYFNNEAIFSTGVLKFKKE
jgi:folate-dependent phosphoribosylglycinamide formyltransferase PurN